MNLKDILQYVKDNGGATLDNDMNIATISDGYMVSIKGYEFIADIDDYYYISDKIKYISNIDIKDKYIGLWLNDGKLYIDCSFNISDYEKAIEKAIINEQLAIYDVSKNNVINI